MDYSRFAKIVVQKIAQYGQLVTLRQYSQGGTNYDPTTLNVTSASLSPTETIVNALVTDTPGKRIGPQYGANMKANTLIADGQKWVYIDASGPKPRPNDKVVIDDTEYTIDDVQTTSPGGVPIYYLLVLYR